MNDDNIFDKDDEELEIVDLNQEDEVPWDELDDEEDDWQDEPEPLKPWTVTLVFAGLVVLAAIICAVLWFFTHREGGADPDATATDMPGVTTESPETESVSPEEQPSDSMETEGTDTEDIDSPEAAGSPEPTADTAAAATPDTDNAPEPQDGDVTMSFEAVQESVTPKDVVNLRSVPSTADADTVVTQASNGEVLARTGINSNTGWSQIDYNGQTLYAVTQYLTTDLSYKTPVTPADPNRVSTISGRIIIFTDCDDQITPKEYVNLRTEPSTTEGDSTVSCQVSNGESVHRTGVSSDSGWSRVEYNGQVLYVVTSLMQAVQ